MEFLKPEKTNSFIAMGLDTIDIHPLTIEITYETLKYLKDNNYKDVKIVKYGETYRL